MPSPRRREYNRAHPFTRAARGPSPASSRRGMTLVELMLAMIVVGLLTAIALPSYRSHLDKMNLRQAINDIRLLELDLERYQTQRGGLPTSLAAAGISQLDPWGNAYQDLRMEGASVGQVRKDHAQHPLNTDYDLYSMGADGRSVSPLTARHSRDDIIRARNGGFIDIASKY
jgi:general secretion pathway protein G